MVRRLAVMVGAALLFSAGAMRLIGRLGRDWEARVAVRGHSMDPTLLDGDWLLVDPSAFEHRPPRDGELVVARDPRAPGRTLVKRARQTHQGLALGSDHPAHADDHIRPVSQSDLLGRPWFRYWPRPRIGPVH
jgi:signal peptidase I